MDQEEQVVDEDYNQELRRIFQEAAIEVAYEENQKEFSEYSSEEYNGLGGYESDNNYYIEQDVQAILDDAKLERDARADGLIKPEKGSRKFATVPMAAVIEYYDKTGIDILGAEPSRDKWEMQKFRMWIQNNHPEFLTRNPGTKFHTVS